MNFEWDTAKAERNLRKHSISFHEAATVFDDPLSMTYYDPDHSMGESRFMTVGMSSAGRVLVVGHTDRAKKVRIISARKISTSERRQYEENN